MVVGVQSLRRVPLFSAPGTAARQASLSPSVSRSLLRFVSVESVMLTISASAALFSLSTSSHVV